MTDLTIIPAEQKQVSLFDMSPKNKVTYVTEMANVLADIIEKQKMYVVIQGKKYVRVESWLALGTMLGIMPHERSVTETPDGSYIAQVDLVRFDTGLTIGGASALCSIDEQRWGKADKYARRSMAVTRATGKAFRLSFSWIMGMAGYESTPAEEMPTFDVEHKVEKYLETPDQKRYFAKVANELGLQEKAALAAASAHCRGLEMSQIKAAIVEVLADGIH